MISNVRMRDYTLGRFSLYYWYQPWPKFSVHYRWKRYKKTLEAAIILNGYWFEIVFDYS